VYAIFGVRFIIINIYSKNMNGEIEFLSGLTKWTAQLRDANLKAQEAKIKIEEEKKKVLDNTVDAKTYCSLLGISHVTLIKRRKRGAISFVEFGGKYRYFIQKEGGQNG
jgi:hypothetical protein